MPDFEFEKQYSSKYKIIAGVDEAGRGALAGPVFASAVIINNLHTDIIIDDSKKLTPETRLLSYYKIIKAYPTSIAQVDNNQIDNINILNATIEAMHTAIKYFNPVPHYLLIDGNFFRDCGIPYKTIIKGDSKSISIAAASIVAKVSRDKYMRDIAHNLYPQYGFDKHKGYATSEHIKNILEFGITPFHRKSFLKKILKEPQLF